MSVRVDTVMTDVVGKLKTISEYLHRQGLDSQANTIIELGRDLAAVYWDAKSHLPPMGLPVNGQMLGVAHPSVPTRPSQMMGVTAMGTGSLPLSFPANDAAYAGLMPSTPISPPGSDESLSSLGGNDIPIKRETLWTLSSAGYNSLTAPMPSLTSLPMAGNNGSLLQSPPGLVHSGGVSPLADQKAGIVFVKGPWEPGDLSKITSKIQEGPLFSVHIDAPMGYAEIHFLHLSQAYTFVENDRKAKSKVGHGAFGPEFEIASVDPDDWNDEIKTMNALPRQRRRLTFARGGFLGANLSFKRFESDLASIAGKNNIDFMWFFNLGNVTAVLNSVPVARKTRNYFLQKAAQPGPYKDVQVTFSADPCEKVLVLASQCGPNRPPRVQQRPFPGTHPQRPY